VRSETLKPFAAALAMMPWTVGPSSLQEPTHSGLTIPSALPVRMWTSGPPESPKISGPVTEYSSASSKLRTAWRRSCVPGVVSKPRP
jgi:hypothetical protein